MYSGSQQPHEARRPSTPYSFFVQHRRRELEETHPDDKINFVQFIQDSSQKWSQLPDPEKAHFDELANQDKKRFEQPLGDNGKKRKQEMEEEPTVPRSAFYMFCNDERANVLVQYPDSDFGQIATKLGRMWIEAEPTVKAKYEDLAEKDEARYEAEMSAYRKKGKNT